MRAIPEGFTQTLDVLVTDDMTVQFSELGAVHPVYATYWLARHFEEAGRKIILPFLDDGEGGIGSQVEVTHTASALPGMRVTVTAVLGRVEGRRVFCRMSAVNELGDDIGRGMTAQVVLAQERIDANFDSLRARWADHTR